MKVETSLQYIWGEWLTSKESFSYSQLASLAGHVSGRDGLKSLSGFVFDHQWQVQGCGFAPCAQPRRRCSVLGPQCELEWQLDLAADAAG
jgi:hypothetical protein